MNREIYHIKIITPCFCAGASQSEAEVRAPSFRGQLRWWFRALGGSMESESSIFGTVAGDSNSRSSSLIVRVADFKRGPAWTPPPINQNTPQNYIWHFASVSGTAGRGQKGPRWTSSGVVPPQSELFLHILWRRPLPTDHKLLFDRSLHAFLALGTLGLRGTRGLGAFTCREARSIDEQRPVLAEAGFVLRERTTPAFFHSYNDAIRDYGAWLRYGFRREWIADRPSPLGASDPRQTSAVRFRPIELQSGQFTWLAYEAPHHRVLSEASRTSRPILEGYSFVGDPPKNQGRR